MACIERWKIWVGLLLGGLLLSGFLTNQARADEPEFKTQITAILDQGWKLTPQEKILNELADHYQAAKQALPGDGRAPYAYLLVLIRQRKFDDALKLAEILVGVEKTNWPALRARIWLQVLTKQHAAALVEMNALTKILPPPAEAKGEAEEEILQTCAFLGRMFAYLEGPAAGSVNETNLLDHKTKVWERLSESRRDAYEKGYKRVAARFAELTQGKQQSQADAKAEEDKQKETAKRELATEKAQLEKDFAAVDAKMDKVRADLDKELADLDAQIRPLEAQLNQYRARISAISSDLAVLQANVVNLLNQANLTRDRNEQAALQAEAQRQDLLAARADNDLRNTQAQANEINGRRLGFLGRRQAAENRAQANLDALDKQTAQLRNTQKRIGFDEQKANKPSTGTTAKVLALSTSAISLSTYDELPLEEEKQRILASLK